MKRIKPTKDIIWNATGGDYNLLKHVHHGLYECPLKEVYSFLNLNELIVFASESWEARNRGELNEQFIQESDIYLIFNEFNQKGFKRLNGLQSKSIKLKAEYIKYNPHGKNLKQRLSNVCKTEIEKMKNQLKGKTKQYLAEEEYYRMRGLQQNMQDYIFMRFLTSERNRNKSAKKYAAEISRMLRDYSTLIEPSFKKSYKMAINPPLVQQSFF